MKSKELSSLSEISSAWCPHYLMMQEVPLVDSIFKTISQCQTFSFCVCAYLIPELMKCIQCYMTSCLILKQTWKIQLGLNLSEMQMISAVLFCLTKLCISTLMFC